MVRIFIGLIVIIFIAWPCKAHVPKPVIRIACIGASITQGVFLSNPEKQSYPGQLQVLLGGSYKIFNFGASGTTLLNGGDNPYINSEQFKSALTSNPDIVFIDLGGNDSKLVNRVHLDSFQQDYKDLIHSFAALPSHPRIVLLLPIPSFIKDTTQIWDPVIINRIIPHTRQVAYETNLEVVDLHSLLIDKSSLMPDQIHPDAKGASIIAERLNDLLQQRFETGFDISKKIETTNASSFFGFTCFDFVRNGRACKVVMPKRVASGHPWVWRARFWGHEPQTDIALLERGFHLVYCDAVELFGNAEAVKIWNDYYSFLRKCGLSKKAVLEGMSRGAVYIYNWAAENPDKVACIYVDNPVLDLKSWPGSQRRNQGAARNEWEIFKKDYGYNSDEAALSFAGSPIDKIDKIVKGGYPMLHVCGDADEAVPMEENTLPFEKRVIELKGNIIVMHKPGFKHHPHSFPNPAPIVNFILKATGFVVR
jgi:lysophospholipase L1-like esterase